METRLNKFLAHAGVCSRREADRMIVDGLVRVNGRIVQELGLKIDSSRDRVVADGRTVQAESEGTVFVLLFKPAGPIVSVKDPFGRPTVMDFLPKLAARVYPVGRLDAETDGALLLTNDGETAHRLTHPRYGVPKVYEALVEGQAAEEDLDKVRRGLFLEGRRTAPARVRVLRRGSDWTLVGLEMHEGRKREIRKLLEAVGHRVTKLRRVAFAGLTLEGLKPGQWRYLKKAEIDRLRALIARQARPHPPA
ncbi:MAG: rRNA pseudouridine synthase [Candidatus Aminicenantes bacterium]|nr:rRNA pseudouridine synthase [Candidatus Aminicenantes bacterium]